MKYIIRIKIRQSFPKLKLMVILNFLILPVTLMTQSGAMPHLILK